MAASQWHRFYGTSVAASPNVLFQLLSDMPNYENVRTLAAVKSYAEK